MSDATLDPAALRAAGLQMRIVMEPPDDSAGVLDEDEKARLWVGGIQALLGAALIGIGIFAAADQAERNLLMGFGGPLIPGGAVVALGGKPKK